MSARPPGVPAEAKFRADAELWELGRDGELRQWRADGTLYLRGRQEKGKLAGPFAIYHPNGQVAREGSYRDGELDGEVRSYGSEAETPEVLRGCCVPETAWQMRSRYVRGQLHGDTFLDREGHVLLSDGSRRPERAPGVPETAEFDEYSGRWGLGATDDNGSWAGAWRFWTVDGRLDEEAEYGAGFKALSRVFDERGQIKLELRYEADGVPHGPGRRRFLDGDDSPHADPRIREERGAYAHGHPVGPWTFHDQAGEVIRAVDYGPAPGDEALADRPVFADERRDAAAWAALARELHASHATREALCAAARAAAAQGSAEALRALLAETTVPASPAASERLLAGLTDAQGTVSRVLSALVGGADPAAVLRTLASVLKGRPRASADFIDAAILLAPDRPMTYMTRALLRFELGDPEGARADADRVEPESAEAASFLRHYARVLFPAFGFWPAREIPHSTLEDLPETPVQPLEAVTRAIQTYATRLTLAREALERQVPGAPWLPPPVAHLLPDGPLPLRDFDAEIVDETDQGPEASTVRVEEALSLEDWSVPGLMRLARSHWAGLCWLCWSAGLDRVALPASLDPPANFPQAAGMAIGRYWRAQDAVATGGLRALSAGVPSFVWEELDMDGIPRHFAEMAQEELLEMRSVFLFLMSPENVSPFQSDLRQA